MRLGLAVPFYDEAPLVDAVVADLRRALAGLDAVVVLVDNGSTDGTGRKLDALADGGRLRALHLPENAGYGGGILAGLRALPGDRDAVGWAWGDGQVDPAILPRLLRRLEDGADLAKARRVERRDGWRRRLVTAAYAGVMRGLGARTRDVNGCPKLLRRAAFARIAPRSADWFLDAEVVLAAESLGLRIAEEPAVMAPRAAGRSKVDWRTVAEFAGHLARWRLTGRAG